MADRASVHVALVDIGVRGDDPTRFSRVIPRLADRLNGALTRIAAAPFRYWDTTPSRRVTNRFSADFETSATSLADQMRHCVDLSLTFLVNLSVTGYVSPVFIPPVIVIVTIYIRPASTIFVHSNRDPRHLVSQQRIQERLQTALRVAL